jgi:hypothetical protein
MSVAKILRTTFELIGEECTFEQAVESCRVHGVSDLNLGTFRTNKSLWKRDKKMMGAASVAVASVAAPAPSPSLDVDLESTPQIPEYAFEDAGVDEHTKQKHFTPPTIDSTFVINKDLHGLFDAIHKTSFKKPRNVILTGPTGCGKTATAMEFAARYKRPLLVCNCSLMREPRDWYGFKKLDPKTGEVVWHKSLFYKFVQVHGAVVVLDELNRVAPMVMNSLFPLLDDRRSAYLEESGETVQVGKNVVFFATTNIGRQYSGTVNIDLANADRFSTKIEVTYLPEDKEAELLHTRTGLAIDDCKKLTSVATHVRRKAASDASDSFGMGISTRVLLNAAELMAMNGPSTLKQSLLSHYSADGGESSERAQLLKLLQGKFGPVIAS